MKKGILLVNLGTPRTPHPRDVYRYLIEFLTDPRVIDFPWLKRQLLVRGLIVPLRYKASAKSYQTIWTEKGSPLLMHTENVKNKLQEALGLDYKVEIAMRYQEPSIERGLQALKEAQQITVLPLFPHYASATVGSVHEKVMKTLAKWETIPKIRLIDHYYDHPTLIQAFAERGQQYPLQEYDKVLFSFHGLPVRQLKKVCQVKPGCCDKLCSQNRSCYAAQCYQTAHLIANELQLPAEKYQIAFQSRLGRDPWIEPFTNDTLKTWASQGIKKVLVFCPAFVSDCLETLQEIGIEYASEFKHLGGERLDLVEGLNDHPKWIQTLREMIS